MYAHVHVAVRLSSGVRKVYDATSKRARALRGLIRNYDCCFNAELRVSLCHYNTFVVQHNVRVEQASDHAVRGYGVHSGERRLLCLEAQERSLRSRIERINTVIGKAMLRPHHDEKNHSANNNKKNSVSKIKC